MINKQIVLYLFFSTWLVLLPPVFIGAQQNDSTVEYNVFLEQVMKIVNSPLDIVNFDGPTIKYLFGNKDSKAVFIGPNSGTRSWSDVIRLINESPQVVNSSDVKAVHIHNENTLGDILEYVRMSKPKGERAIKLSENEVSKIVGETPYPFVMTNSIDENWGFLSTPIGTRTTKWYMS
jgi:hypothetical protein